MDAVLVTRNIYSFAELSLSPVFRRKWPSRYALTTHKAQGSTINYVFLDLADISGCSERQKLLYTALTRTRTQVLIPH